MNAIVGCWTNEGCCLTGGVWDVDKGGSLREFAGLCTIGGVTGVDSDLEG